MNAFENVELDLTNVLIAICSSVIIYFAWKSTNVRENRLPPATLFVLEGNRRRLLGLGNSRQPVNVIARSQTPEQMNTRTEETNTRRDEITEVVDRTAETTVTDTSNTANTPNQDLLLQEAPTLQSIIDEVADIAMSDYNRTAEETVQNLLDDNDFGPRQIVEEMDSIDSHDTGLRHRRVVNQDENATAGSNTRSTTRRQLLNLQVDSTIDNSHAENCSNENNENENISKTEERSAERVQSNANNSDIPSVMRASNTDLEDKNDEFRIKLKYLNDDLRLVTGTPNEAIGDFKKRNFSVELASEKLVRLVFNGHVLQPDSKTLQACGLFHNCVVHCLIHSKKPTNPGLEHGSNRNQNENESTAQRTIDDAGVFVDRSTNGRSFILLGAVVITLAITFSWYCRLQYSYLFSWYSTVGLVLMTILFLITFPLIILVEREVSM